MKTLRIVIGTLAAVLVVGGPAAAFFGPMPVTDVGPVENHTWLATLVQAIATRVNLDQMVQIAVQNTTPTGAGWPNSTQDPRSTEPILDGQVQALNASLAVLKSQTGVSQAPDAALGVAEAAMQQLPGEVDDISRAQGASDSADGDLAAQQAGHRISVLQVTNETKTRQFLYAQQLQRSTDEAAAMAWMSSPSVTANTYRPSAGDNL